MITGVQNFYYYTNDMGKALKFYTEVLGMDVTFSDDSWSNLSCGGVTIGLHQTESGEIPFVPRNSHGALAGGTLTLKSDDVGADRDKIALAGGKILGETDADWGHMLVFQDLDQNVLMLMHPKY